MIYPNFGPSRPLAQIAGHTTPSALRSWVGGAEFNTESTAMRPSRTPSILEQLEACRAAPVRTVSDGPLRSTADRISDLARSMGITARRLESFAAKGAVRVYLSDGLGARILLGREDCPQAVKRRPSPRRTSVAQLGKIHGSYPASIVKAPQRATISP